MMKMKSFMNNTNKSIIKAILKNQIMKVDLLNRNWEREITTLQAKVNLKNFPIILVAKFQNNLKLVLNLVLIVASTITTNIIKIIIINIINNQKVVLDITSLVMLIRWIRSKEKANTVKGKAIILSGIAKIDLEVQVLIKKLKIWLMMMFQIPKMTNKMIMIIKIILRKNNEKSSSTTWKNKIMKNKT